MSFGLSIDGGALEWGSRGLGAIFAQRRNMFSPSFLRMVWDVVRFGREAPEVTKPRTKHKAGRRTPCLSSRATVPSATPHSRSSKGAHGSLFGCSSGRGSQRGPDLFHSCRAMHMIRLTGSMYSAHLCQRHLKSHNTLVFGVHCGLDRGERLVTAGAEAEQVCGAQPWTVHQGEGL